MSPPLAVVAAAESFWSDAGVELMFPRPVRRAVALCHPISVVVLSALHVTKVEDWLRRQGKTIELVFSDRPLRACLVAYAGAGIIFVDGADSEDEQRFSIAHELAHFLFDYLNPRRVAVARLGEGILDVLDGRRLARTEERVVGILTEVEVRPHIHLMNRFDDLAMSDEIEQSEVTADALALELVAPWEDVIEQIAALGISVDRSAISWLLVERYGLPPMVADDYAARLCPAPLPTSPLLQHLRCVELLTRQRNNR